MMLFDKLTKENVQEVESLEHAAQIVGAIMSHFGQNFTQNRYVVYGRVNRKGAAPVLWGPNELHNRGKYYYKKR